MDKVAEYCNGAKLAIINRCRFSLQIVTLSNMTSIDGYKICNNYYHRTPSKITGRTSNYKWPYGWGNFQSHAGKNG